MIQNKQAKNKTEKVVEKNPIVHCKLITNVSFFCSGNQSEHITLLILYVRGITHLTSYNHWLWIRVRLILLAWHLHENETKGNENESKGVQFPAVELSLIKLIGAANRQSPAITRKILPLYHRNIKLGCVLTNAIRVYTDRPIAGVIGA